MNALERHIELTRHFVERQAERAAPADQNVIVPVLQASCIREPHKFTQATLDSVALDCVANLSRHREAHARPVHVRALARLQHKGASGHPHSGSGSPKVRPTLQPLHGQASLERVSARHALSRLRPCARRAATTLRPPFVAMRARKPCRRLRTSLLGW
jgi:hypothetical protein